jgi:hypothetical protein
MKRRFRVQEIDEKLKAEAREWLNEADKADGFPMRKTPVFLQVGTIMQAIDCFIKTRDESVLYQALLMAEDLHRELIP